MISYESIIDEFYSTDKTSVGFEEERVVLGPRDSKTFQHIGRPIHESLSDSKAKRSRSLQDVAFGYRYSLENSKDGGPESARGHLCDVTVRCGDNGGPNVEYTINGIASHEMPVIGMYVDRRISPGFPYRVRYVGSFRDVYDGKPKTLTSIGMGYTHRLTFDSDSLNHNDNVFWSDSQPAGFAFSIQAVSPGDVFVIYDVCSMPLGEAKVESLSSAQEEIDTRIENGAICKTVRVWLVCSVVYFQGHHGLVDLNSPSSETIVGNALVVKSKGDKRAQVVCISNVCLSRNEECTLRRD
ncbi:uncharacterized protein LOC121390202 [Gigantopelta aegis]|uniref:uncharacterized protein LOC121390202 n=1 Tax=Gigantopelta aegis TaxID=1735272 RepID=UPI001B88CF3B|nr:uncharacterized protein LOC121390202 [Gigantopelta aegis]